MNCESVNTFLAAYSMKYIMNETSESFPYTRQDAATPAYAQSTLFLSEKEHIAAIPNGRITCGIRAIPIKNPKTAVAANKLYSFRSFDDFMFCFAIFDMYSDNSDNVWREYSFIIEHLLLIF